MTALQQMPTHPAVKKVDSILIQGEMMAQTGVALVLLGC